MIARPCRRHEVLVPQSLLVAVDRIGLVSAELIEQPSRVLLAEFRAGQQGRDDLIDGRFPGEARDALTDQGAAGSEVARQPQDDGEVAHRSLDVATVVAAAGLQHHESGDLRAAGAWGSGASRSRGSSNTHRGRR